jgi:hypothetical protein
MLCDLLRHALISDVHLQVLPNGNLVFPPFRAEDYRQEVHAQVYVCLGRNSVGSVHSRDVHVRAGNTSSHYNDHEAASTSL